MRADAPIAPFPQSPTRSGSLGRAVVLLGWLGVASAADGGPALVHGGERPDPTTAPVGVVNGAGLERTYRRWKVEHENAGGDRYVSIHLGGVRGLSSGSVAATGRARLDLIRETVTVTVYGAGHADLSDVWLVDNQPGPGRSAKPEGGDIFVGVGRLIPDEGKSTLHAPLPGLLASMDVDVVLVTRRGEEPTRASGLVGVPSLFQRLYTRTRRHLRSHPETSIGESARVLGELASVGADLFFGETFRGNGRTCGSCHPADNNFTIDPDYVARLSPDDPLFVAEFVPELRRHFERPDLLRRVGLILENPAGFDDLKNRYVMRGVPHLLALGTSLRPAPNVADGTVKPPVERTGWAGDGAPGSGSLREFTVGAVRQHLTKTLKREPGRDFRVPTDAELDALEAFMLSLGREQEIDLQALELNGETARRGKEIFLADDTREGTVAAGKCDRCHHNAGGTVRVPAGGFSFNFDTGVEDLPDTPAQLFAGTRIPRDEGFGAGAVAEEEPGRRGRGTFNTPPLVEAADTAPFFHNNSAATLEAAVSFYNSESFRNSPAGQALASQDSGGIGIRLEPTQVVAVAVFLRVLNALENIRSAASNLEATEGRSFLPRTSLDSVTDALDVLRGHEPRAVRHLREAERALLETLDGDPPDRGPGLRRALDALSEARKSLLRSTPSESAPPVATPSNEDG